MPIYALAGNTPVIATNAFIAPSADVIGRVHIGDGASIWFNVVLRGDGNDIRIGAGSNIQDGTVVHIATNMGPTLIGEHVLVGHQALIHGCTLEDHAFVGFAAQVMDGCVVETDAMLAAGALLTPGKRVPTGELWAGRPAKFLRALTADNIAQNRAGVEGYRMLGQMCRTALKRVDI